MMMCALHHTTLPTHGARNWRRMLPPAVEAGFSGT